MLFKPSEEATFFKTLFSTKPKSLGIVAVEEPSSVDSSREQLSDIEGESKHWGVQDRNQRFERLEQIIRAVKNVKDVNLNNQFDAVMDIEMKNMDEPRRCDSDVVAHTPMNLEESVYGLSYPGLN